MENMYQTKSQYGLLKLSKCFSFWTESILKALYKRSTDELPHQIQISYPASAFTASDGLAKSCTHCTGRAGGTVQILGGVLLFFRQRWHGGGQRGARAGVWENKNSFSSAGGVAGPLEDTIAVFRRRPLLQELLLVLELEDHEDTNTCALCN